MRSTELLATAMNGTVELMVLDGVKIATICALHIELTRTYCMTLRLIHEIKISIELESISAVCILQNKARK